MATTEQIQIYAANIMIDAQDTRTSRVTLTGIDTDDVLANFSTEEILESLIAQDKFSELTDLVTKSMNEDE